MPWIFSTRAPGPTLGIEAKVWWRRPNFVPDSEPFVEIPMPSDVGGVDEIPTDTQYEGTRYFAGGFTQNTLVTRDLLFWSQGIDAPLEIPNVSLSGTGITAEVVVYWRYFDDKTGERSPLSGGKSLSPANQAIVCEDFPTSKNPRVTHIELWISLDGSLPRFLLRRQTGAGGTITIAPAAGDLGEADTEEFGRFPRCRVNAIYHDRQAMGGDELNRSTLYLSLIGLPERMSVITLKTRNGEPIVGLQVVNDRLLVFCPFSIYTVDGFTEDDLVMQVAKPDIGLIGPNAKAMVGGMLQFYSDRGPWITDASGFFFIGDDIQATYVKEYRAEIGLVDFQTFTSSANLNSYENAWCINNIKDYCTRLWVERNSSGPVYRGRFIVAHYAASKPDTAGGFAQPAFSYDTCLAPYTCGGLLTLPGSRQTEVYSASRNSGAFLLRENVRRSFEPIQGGSEPNGFAGTDHDTIGMIVRTGSNCMDDEGDDLAHGKSFTDFSLFLRSDRRPGDPDTIGFETGFIVSLWTGDVVSAGMASADLEYNVGGLIDTVNFTPVFRREQDTEPLITTPSFPDADDPRTVTAKQPKTTWNWPLARCPGDALVVEVQCFDPEATFYGWQAGWKSGPKYRQAVSATFGDFVP